MTLKRWCFAASVFMMASLTITSQVVSAETHRTFRQENGLQIYVPPDWFLEGYFVAREKHPEYVFGPVRNFAGTLGGKTTWLIEDLELKRIQSASTNGKKIEYSVFLEVVSPAQTTYWVFVVMPYENGQAWYDARRAYHGRQAEKYYGDTPGELDRALEQGVKVSAELRFWIENGEVRPQPPEDVIMGKFKFQPVFDLGTGRRQDSTAETK